MLLIAGALSLVAATPKGEATLIERQPVPRAVWRLFVIAIALLAVGVAIQFSLPVWSLNPQAFLAINVVVELSRAALCFFMFGVRWLTRNFRVDSQSLFISSAFLALGILTIARLLTFSGMPLAGSYSELVNAPYFGTFSNFSDSLYYDTIIRISLGGLLLVALLVSPIRSVSASRMKYYPLAFIGYAAVGIILISAFDHLLPPLYVAGEGMTSVRTTIGIVAIAVTFVAALAYARVAARTSEGGYLMVCMGLVLMTEAQFSFYRVTAPLDLFLLVGRTMALIAWFAIFLGIVKPSLTRPYENLESARREIDRAGADLAALSRDIIERREAEEKILALNAELESKARELQTSNKELESFCYSVSHDLRAPLRGIDGFTKLLSDEEGPALTDQGKEYINKTRNSCQRMATIIDDLLKLSRVVREEIRFSEFDISKLVRAVGEEIQAANPNRTVKLTVCAPEIVVGDERLLRIAIENLLQNAWKFTSKTKSAAVEFGVTTIDNERVFFVRDNGAGFDMAFKDKLFRPFERLHSETDFPGTGVGLASVKRVVERHGGRVWAFGGVDKGATFYFTLNADSSER